MESERYVRKTYEIEAIRLDLDNASEICDWTETGILRTHPYTYVELKVTDTRGAQTRCRLLVGDWVFRKDDGSFHILSDEEFREEYELTNHRYFSNTEVRKRLLEKLGE